MKRLSALALTVLMVLSLLAGCVTNPQPTTGKPTTGATLAPTVNNPTTTVPPTTAPADPWESYDCLTLAEAIAICQQTGTTETTDKYYVRGTITEISNEKYGNMTISDGTDSLFIYGTYSADGSTRFDGMAETPAVGDEVLLYGTLVNYNNSKPEMMNAWIIDYVQGEIQPPVFPEFDTTLTIAEMLTLPLSSGEVTEGRYYVIATVKSVSKPEFGAMIIEDETGSISIYGSYNADGSVGYANMENKPVKGDKVKLYVTVQNFNGTMEIKNAWIVEVVAGESSYDPADYTDMTILQARDAAKGDKIRLTGVVARITYADGMVPLGFILVDGTDSFFIYGTDAASSVSIGNTVTVAGTKAMWIRDQELTHANKYDYKGCAQLEDVYLTANDKGNSDFDKSWITECTVQDMLNTSFDADVTGRIFKVTALVKRVDGNGFINYYINDLDGYTGSYSYTQCSGSDFAWLDEFDGKICTVYLTAINAKAAASGCVWRFLPVAVKDEGYTPDILDQLYAGLRLYAMPQFLTTYTGDPAMELISAVNIDLLGVTGMEISYSSTNPDVVWFEEVDGKIIFHCGKPGTAEVNIFVRLGNEEVFKDITITVKDQQAVDYGTVQDAINAELGQTVVIKGVVGPSLVNQDGFYLIDETGIIAILTDKETLASLELGYEIVLEGTRYFKSKSGGNWGNTCVSDAKVLVNNYGNHAYSTESFDGTLTLAEFAALDVNVDYTTYVFTVTATVEVVETPYYTNIKLVDGDVTINLYCSSAKQYAWLQEYAGQTITLELAPCNWSSKDTYPACVLAVVLEDGTKIVNTLNFN